MFVYLCHTVQPSGDVTLSLRSESRNDDSEETQQWSLYGHFDPTRQEIKFEFGSISQSLYEEAIDVLPHTTTAFLAIYPVGGPTTRPLQCRVGARSMVLWPYSYKRAITMVRDQHLDFYFAGVNLENCYEFESSRGEVNFSMFHMPELSMALDLRRTELQGGPILKVVRFF